MKLILQAAVSLLFWGEEVVHKETVYGWRSSYSTNFNLILCTEGHSILEDCYPLHCKVSRQLKHTSTICAALHLTQYNHKNHQGIDNEIQVEIHLTGRFYTIFP